MCHIHPFICYSCVDLNLTINSRSHFNLAYNPAHIAAQLPLLALNLSCSTTTAHLLGVSGACAFTHTLHCLNIYHNCCMLYQRSRFVNNMLIFAAISNILLLRNGSVVAMFISPWHLTNDWIGLPKRLPNFKATAKLEPHSLGCEILQVSYDRGLIRYCNTAGICSLPYLAHIFHIWPGLQ